MPDTKEECIWLRHCEEDQCTTDPIQGEVEGSLPDWLSGVLYRTGPGVHRYGREEVRHAFDAGAIMHAIEVRINLKGIYEFMY